MRIAFFGGTFDPPHRGHLSVAREAVERLSLDCVLVAPVAAQPLKSDSRVSSFEDRLAMVRLTVDHDPHLIASSADAPRPGGGANYTFDTLVNLRRKLSPEDVLFNLVGADSFLTLRQWYRSAELLLSCNFIVAARPGFSLEEATAQLPPGIEICGEQREPKIVRLDLRARDGGSSTLYLLPELKENISATEIRRALADGAELQTLLSPKVVAYIRSHALYR